MSYSLLNNQFDNLLKNHGIPENELILIGSKQYSGSSLLNISMASNILRQNLTVLHVNLEGMRKLEIKYLANLSELAIDRIKNNDLNLKEKTKCNQILKMLTKKLKIITPTSKELNYNSIINLIEQELLLKKYNVIIIDYPQVLEEKHTSNKMEFSKIVKNLQYFANYKKITIISPMKMSKYMYEQNENSYWNNLYELRFIKTFLTMDSTANTMKISLIKERDHKILKSFSTKIDFNTINCLKSQNYAINIIKQIDNLIKK
jgi:hypothetical protein